MSEQLDNAAFVGEGYKGNASLYGEQQVIHQYATLETVALEYKASHFADILNNPQTLNNHRVVVDRLLGHVAFELGWRAGHEL